MKKIILLIIFLSILGCTSGQRGFVDQDLRVGTVGLQASFIESAPPFSVKQNQFVPIYVEVKNNGAADVETGYFHVQGNENKDLRITPVFGTYHLAGKSITSPIGERQLIQIKGETGSLIGAINKKPSFFEIKLCYDYNTHAAVPVCIDTDFLGQRIGQKPCIVKTQSLSGGQGGPVGITKVTTKKALLHEKKSGRVIPSFDIVLANFGQGEVLAPNQAAKACSGFVSDLSEEYIEVDVRLSDKSLDCTFEGKKIGSAIKLGKKGISLNCKLTEGISMREGTFISPLQVTLDYGYTQTLSRTITITK